MGFRKDAYAKVWDVTPKSDTNTQLRISVSRKNKQTGEYEQDFSGFVSCVGTHAAKKAAGLKPESKIKIGDCDVSTSYNKEKNVTYTNFKIFDFDIEDGNKAVEATPAVEVDNGEPEESDLPF